MADSVSICMAIRGVSLRTETPQDACFLKNLYITVRWQEFTQAGWPDEVLSQFLSSQFELQCRSYALQFPAMVRSIVSLDDTCIGRLYMHRSPRNTRIVDIALMPECRNSGIGTAILRQICAKAAAEGKTVTLHVDSGNPAKRLYLRLGFRETQWDGMGWQMEWTPAR